MCMSKSHRSLCELFSRTAAELGIYRLLVWSKLNFSHICQCITLPTQSCLVLYCFCANLLQKEYKTRLDWVGNYYYNDNYYRHKKAIKTDGKNTCQKWIMTHFCFLSPPFNCCTFWFLIQFAFLWIYSLALWLSEILVHHRSHKYF